MYGVRMYTEVRRDCLVNGMSIRAAAQKYKLHRKTVKKMLDNPIPISYKKTQSTKKQMLKIYQEFIDAVLVVDKSRPKKQKHTMRRIYDRLKDETDYKGCYTTVRNYVRSIFDNRLCAQINVADVSDTSNSVESRNSGSSGKNGIVKLIGMVVNYAILCISGSNI